LVFRLYLHLLPLSNIVHVCVFEPYISMGMQ
jgi:hypothetical protein